MIVKILLISSLVINVLASDEMFDSLSGIHGGNKVTLCMDPGKEKDECPGVIWQRHWVLVRGSCLGEKPMYPVIILRTSAAACDTIVPDTKVAGSRKVRSRFIHPAYPMTDVALICLDRPYEALDSISNNSTATLYKLEPWLTDTFNQYLLTTPRAQLIHGHRDMAFSSPVKMFVTTVVLPLTSFIVFFLFVTFSRAQTRVQYYIKAFVMIRTIVTLHRRY